MNLKEKKEMYMGELGGMKEKGGNYFIIISKHKRKN